MHLRRNVLEACRSCRYERPRQLFNRIATQYHPEVAARVAPHRIRFSMRTARWSQFPNIPREMPEVAALLSSEQYAHITSTLQNQGDNIFSAMVGPADNRSLVFVSRRMLGFLKDTKILFADATFASSPTQPEGIVQVYQIVTVVRDTVVPIVIALMESKTYEAYSAILLHLREIAPEFLPEEVMTDFEIAEQQAWMAVFQCAVVGCYVHFIRASTRNFGHLGLRHLITDADDDPVRGILNELLSIPLLPHRLMTVGYGTVVERCRLSGLYDDLLPFLSYFGRTWMSGPFYLTVSVFGKPHRTSNVCESSHWMFRQHTGPYHPNLWVFLDALRTYEYRAYTDVIAFRTGLPMGVGRRVTTVHRDRTIRNFTRDLLDGHISIRRFLNRVARLSSRVISENLGIEGV